jgi:hypothetical protein
VVLQAPEASNSEADLLTCLADYFSSKVRNTIKAVFVTRNEFQALEKSLPDTTQHFVTQLKSMQEKYKSFAG